MHIEKFMLNRFLVELNWLSLFLKKKPLLEISDDLFLDDVKSNKFAVLYLNLLSIRRFMQKIGCKTAKCEERKTAET